LAAEDGAIVVAIRRERKFSAMWALPRR